MRENVFTSEDVRAFAKRLRALREGEGMSQEQLAERLDVSRQVITKWENGSGVPKIDNLIALSDCFHISIDELMGRRTNGGLDMDDDYRKTIEELQDCSRKTVSLIDRAIRLGTKGNADTGSK